MSELWICREQEASRPFRIKAAGVDVGNLEELCFYLYQSRELLDEAVMGEELFAWLAVELKLPRLAASLAEEKKQGRNALWCAYFLLKESGMYSGEELAGVKSLCLAMENKDEFELGKLRGDRFLQNKKYLRGIREYEKLIALSEMAACSTKLLGNVWHNLGTAYAQLFLFGEAAECFAKAYERNQNDDSFLAWQRAEALAREDGSAWQESAARPEGGWDAYLEELKTAYRESVL